MMQDQQPDSPEQREQPEATALDATDDPAQLAHVYPGDFARSDRDPALASLLGGGRGPWRIVGGFAAMFVLGWVGGSNAYRFSDIGTAFSSPPQQAKSLPGNPDSKMKSVARIDGPGRNTISEAGLQASNILKVSASAPSMSGRAPRPSPPGTQLGLGSPSLVVEPASRILPGDLPMPREAMVPAPETKPTTIEGWTVREVRGGTAVLEGPDGVLMAARGDTVPGVGRIDSIVRWDNRWIVETASGLIATP